MAASARMSRLTVPSDQWNAMRAHVDRCSPREGCGLLAGKGDAVRKALEIANQAHDTTRFRMDPIEQIRAFNWIEANGLELVGIYHSHPASPTTDLATGTGPSPTDISEAAYPVVYVIWSRPAGDWQAHGYWIQNSRASEVELLVVPPARRG